MSPCLIASHTQVIDAHFILPDTATTYAAAYSAAYAAAYAVDYAAAYAANYAAAVRWPNDRNCVLVFGKFLSRSALEFIPCASC